MGAGSQRNGRCASVGLWRCGRTARSHVQCDLWQPSDRSACDVWEAKELVWVDLSLSRLPVCVSKREGTRTGGFGTALSVKPVFGGLRS